MEKKGTRKHNVHTVLLIPDSIEGDAHAGKWHRQVPPFHLKNSMAFFKKKKGSDQFGAFGENLLVEGFDFKTLVVRALYATIPRCSKSRRSGSSATAAMRSINLWATASCRVEGGLARVLKEAALFPRGIS